VRTKPLNLALGVVLLGGPMAWGYVEAPFTLGKVMTDSSHILMIRVERVDREKNLIFFRKVQDIKGTHPGDTIKHRIGKQGFHPREWQNIMAWAEEGRNALFFHNGSAGEVCIENYWYQIYGGEWWSLSHAEPYLLRSYAGKPERLAVAVTAMLAGQEVVVPCMVDGDKNALHMRTAKFQRMKASLKILDYNPKRDFVEGGADAMEYRPIAGMPGFSHYLALNRVSPGALGIVPTDFNGDGKPDLCLFGTAKAVVLQNAGGSFDEVLLGLEGGARGAAWADYDGDQKPDLLLATPSGPRLFQNDGKRLVDMSSVLPLEGYYNLTSAAWIDYDGDKRPDILLADGFRGLRLYRNKGPQAEPAKPQVGKWYYAGPFDHSDRRGFENVFPPEQEIDLGKKYPGKGKETVSWREGKFRDGQVNNLRLFRPENNSNCVVYLYRELDYGGAVELPIGLGSDDTLTVWLNGEKIHAENVSRSCQPDQVQLKLKLRPGKNALLLKVCNGDGEFAFAYSSRETGPVMPKCFEDVSSAVRLPMTPKGDHLVVADVNGDGRQDFLHSAGKGVLVLNTPQGFVEAKDCGLVYQAGRVAPAIGDFNGDGRPDVLVPQRSGCRLFRNEGNARFTDVTGQAGELGRPIGDARCAVWADFSQNGRADLFVGCLKGPNRYFRNNGNGTFAEATEAVGLVGSIYNTCAMAVVDVNNDKMPDVIFNNEGRESALLLGSPGWVANEAAKAAALEREAQAKLAAAKAAVARQEAEALAAKATAAKAAAAKPEALAKEAEPAAEAKPAAKGADPEVEKPVQVALVGPHDAKEPVPAKTESAGKPADMATKPAPAETRPAPTKIADHPPTDSVSRSAIPSQDTEAATASPSDGQRGMTEADQATVYGRLWSWVSGDAQTAIVLGLLLIVFLAAVIHFFTPR